MLKSTTQRVTDVAMDLAALEPATLAGTESGILAYYSGWNNTDLWGLNTRRFTRALVQPTDITEISADVMVLHHPTENYEFMRQPAVLPKQEKTWSNMCINVMLGASEGDYVAFFVPFQDATVRDNVLNRLFWALKQAPTLQPFRTLRANVRSRLGRKAGKSLRHDVYYVRRDCGQFDAIVAVLRNHQALSFDEFFSAP